MEKAGALISRLQQQYQQQADESSLLHTALLLVNELQTNRMSNTENGKVSVILPYKAFEIMANESVIEESINNIINADENPDITSDAGKTAQQEDSIIKPYIPEPEPVQTSAINMLAEEKYTDELEQVPTLVQQQPKVSYDLNDTAQKEGQSINDKLKRQIPETGGKLNNEPVKDLRKAIGINDKYLFIKELFRNDETAYERSLKTLNSFSILQEAEYWIQREMKYKLGWDDNDTTVQSFYHLVKRRFS